MSMPMVFTTDHSTPLYSSAWTPNGTGSYAGTCIFLIVLAVISRVLQAYRHVLETKWHDKAIKRRYVVIAGETAEQREKQLGFGEAEKGEEAVLTARGLEERVRVLRTSGPQSMRFRGAGGCWISAVSNEHRNHCLSSYMY